MVLNTDEQFEYRNIWDRDISSYHDTLGSDIYRQYCDYREIYCSKHKFYNISKIFILCVHNFSACYTVLLAK